MSQAEALYRLQEVDLLLLKTARRLDAIAAALQDNQALAAAQAALDAAHRTLTPLRTRQRDLELETQSVLQKVRETEEHLYSGRVKNPKQMQEMEAEIAALRRRNDELQEAMLDMLMQIEAAEAAVEAAEAAVSQAEAASAQTHGHLLTEQTALRNEQSINHKRREAVLADVTPDSLAKYSALRPKKQNQPVAILRGESCMTCGVEQTMAIVRDVQLGKTLVTCASCGRILVYKV